MLVVTNSIENSEGIFRGSGISGKIDVDERNGNVICLITPPELLSKPDISKNISAFERERDIR